MADEGNDVTWIERRGPSFFFWYGLGWALLLLVLAFVYASEFEAWKLSQFDPVGGLLPLAVPWFGALGAVTISLYGVFDHADDWDPSWNYWHMARPVVGAILGTMAFFIFYVLTSAAGSTPSVTTEESPESKMVLLYVLAFLVGYRESTFKELIKRVSDVILKPPDEKAATAAHPTLKKGNRGARVRRLQRLLSNAGNDVKVDGRFGTATEAALKAFQRAHSLTANGVAGAETWEALLAGSHHDSEPGG